MYPRIDYIKSVIVILCPRKQRGEYDTHSFFDNEFIHISGYMVMNSTIHLYSPSISTREIIHKKYIPTIILQFSEKNEREILKAFLLGQLHQLFCELFQKKMLHNDNDSSMECYTMDSKIIQFLIQGIVETGEYTLEGIAFYTHIPFDVIYDAACGIKNQFSITPWARIVDLYLQVKPDITKILIDKLLEMKEKNFSSISDLLKEF